MTWPAAKRLTSAIALIDEIGGLNRRILDLALGLLRAPDIREVARKYAANRASQIDSIGFNVFSIVSDVYHRENLHSDLIAAFLNPQESHNHGDIFLREFLHFLGRLGVGVAPANYSSASVFREKHKIDIWIADDVSKRAIVIENKINGAADMRRQIPRYLESVEADGYVCDAIIYLRLSGGTGPNMTDWTAAEIKRITGMMTVIPAYSGTDWDLTSGWVDRCSAICSKESDPGLLLRHYRKLLTYLGRHAMNKPIMDEFYTFMLEESRFRDALSVKAMLDDLILFRTERIIDTFKSDLAPFTNVGNYRDCDAYFTGLMVGDAHLGIDVSMETDRSVFSFWDRNDRAGSKGKARELLIKMGVFDEYRCEAGPFMKDFAFPSGEADLYQHIRNFKRSLALTISSLAT